MSQEDVEPRGTWEAVVCRECDSAGISGISMALDLTVNGRAETMWVNALHRRFSRKKQVIER
jgi:hypothetical protein